MAERFWDLVNGPWCDPGVGGDDCWDWMGATAGSRRPRHLAAGKPWKKYGRFALGRVNVNAHRMALILTVGEPPEPDMVASHTVCDRPLCCNPIHLRWSSQGDNIREALAKGHLSRSQLGAWASLAAAVVA